MSLRRACRELVLDVVLRWVSAADEEQPERGARWQLIVDQPMLKVLNSFLRMADLHEGGMTSMELLGRQREPLPGLDALYMIRPELENVESLLGDFKAAGAPQHRNVHIAFTECLKDELLNKLAESSSLSLRVKSFVETPLSFVMIEDRGFHFDMPEALPGLFPVPDTSLLTIVARRLADVCRCLQVTTPCIRRAHSEVCQLLAEHVQGLLPPQRAREEQVPCHLLIVDRSIDIAATLVHEYTYEAMMYDLLDGDVLNIDQQIVDLKGTPAKKHLLSDADPLWEELKHRHLEAVQSALESKVGEIQRQAAMKDATQMSTGDMLDMMRKSPEQRDFIERLDLHTSLCGQIFRRLQEESLVTGVGLLEQDIACGIDKSGKPVKPDKLQASLKKTLIDFEKVLPRDSKLRLLMLFFACLQNVPEAWRQQLTDAAKLTSDGHHVLMNMLQTRLMEVPESQRQRNGPGCVHRVTKDQAARAKRSVQADGNFELSRFEPRLKALMEQLAQDELSAEDFPTVGDTAGGGDGMNSLRVAGSMGVAPPGAPAVPAAESWSFAPWPDAGGSGGDAKAAPAVEVVRRIVVFVVGGITHSELRAAAEVAQGLPRGTEVLVGGTAILTPRRFIQTLQTDSGPEPGGGTGIGSRLSNESSPFA